MTIQASILYQNYVAMKRDTRCDRIPYRFCFNTLSKLRSNETNQLNVWNEGNDASILYQNYVAMKRASSLMLIAVDIASILYQNYVAMKLVMNLGFSHTLSASILYQNYVAMKLSGNYFHGVETFLLQYFIKIT